MNEGIGRVASRLMMADAAGAVKQRCDSSAAN
jgi:hypothetical protein